MGAEAWTAHFSYFFTKGMPLLVGERLGCSVALKPPWMTGPSSAVSSHLAHWTTEAGSPTAF